MPELVIHKLADWEAHEIFALREDLLPFACGVNRVRIALKLIADAELKGATDIVGYRNSRSNLCRLLAMLCSREGLGCVILSPPGDGGSRVETSSSRIVFLVGRRSCHAGSPPQLPKPWNRRWRKSFRPAGDPITFSEISAGSGTRRSWCRLTKKCPRALRLTGCEWCRLLQDLACGRHRFDICRPVEQIALMR